MPSRRAMALFGKPLGEQLEHLHLTRGQRLRNLLVVLRRAADGRDQNGVSPRLRTRALPRAWQTHLPPRSRHRAAPAFERDRAPGRRAARASVRGTLTNGDGDIGRRSTPQQAQRRLAADKIANQQVEQIFRRLDRVSVQLEQDIADDARPRPPPAPPVVTAITSRRFVPPDRRSLVFRATGPVARRFRDSRASGGRARARSPRSATQSTRE